MSYKYRKGKRTLKKRRKENKTDYKARLNMLKSGKLRMVVRLTNKYIILQAVESYESKDKVIAGITSKHLLDYGWQEGSLKNKKACYLTGYLLSKKLKGKELILDIGMAVSHPKGRLYAAVKGLIDGGVKINVNKEMLPEIEDDKIKEKIDKNG
ncbi:MAG: 50S ribosomal protein L18 [Candidatus Nanoarchaeia archaeon]